MTIAILSAATSFFSNWLGAIPAKKTDADPLNGDWAYVRLEKHGIEHTYILQKSTGDLYLGELLVEAGGEGKYVLETRGAIAVKALTMGILATPYCAALMAGNLCKALWKVTSVFFRVLPYFVHDLLKLGFLPSVVNLTIRSVVEIPLGVGEDLWRILRAPFYALALIAACGVGFFSPLEGRVWIAQVEKEWHQGDSYKMDLRESHAYTNKQIAKAIFNGKYYFLGWCMQKRGNIEDREQGEEVYQWV